MLAASFFKKKKLHAASLRVFPCSVCRWFMAADSRQGLAKTRLSPLLSWRWRHHLQTARIWVRGIIFVSPSISYLHKSRSLVVSDFFLLTPFPTCSWLRARSYYVSPLSLLCSSIRLKERKKKGYSPCQIDCCFFSFLTNKLYCLTDRERAEKIDRRPNYCKCLF